MTIVIHTNTAVEHILRTPEWRPAVDSTYIDTLITPTQISILLLVSTNRTPITTDPDDSNSTTYKYKYALYSVLVRGVIRLYMAQTLHHAANPTQNRTVDETRPAPHGVHWRPIGKDP